MSVQTIPEGFHTVTPYLTVKGGFEAIDFYKKAFGATEKYRMDGPGGLLGHAELTIGNSNVMLADEFPDMGGKGPKTLGGSPIVLYLYVEDVDSFYKKAIEAGGKELKPVTNQFYGDRAGFLEDPFGHKWWVATHIEDVSKEEMKKRMDNMMGGGEKTDADDSKKSSAQPNKDTARKETMSAGKK